MTIVRKFRGGVKNLMKNKRKRMAALAGIMAVVIASGVTYAWQSISQTAVNEAASEANNPGCRLHDDFDGRNKDIYVENFTDPTDGMKIYARVRLSEYMELGHDAGRKFDDPAREVTSVMPGARLEDKKTWHIYVPEDPENLIHSQYWEFETGGSTVFMPTFNKNRDSLAADINGTFAGPDGDPETWKDRYEDYVEYTSGQTRTDNAIYDADDNDVDEGDDGVEGINFTTQEETHTAKETQSGTVITMAEWKAAGANPGKYWVYDTDGWAYWAEAIWPGEATGLLTDGLIAKTDIRDNWYYAVDITGQFATAGDWGDKAEESGFYEDGISEDGLFLLNLVSGKLRVVTGEDGKQYIDNGDGTFQEKKEDGTLGDPIWAGPDRKPGNEDDKPIIIGAEDGKNYVDNGDGTYSEVKDNGTLGRPIYPGEDGTIGTGDDKPVVTGEDGKKYVDNGDGTFSEIEPNGNLGDMFCPGEDGKIGTDDDKPVTVIDPADEIYGSKFLGPNPDGSYYAIGEDGVLGSDEDIKVWPNPTLTAGNITDIDPRKVDTVTVTAEGNVTEVEAGYTLQFQAEVAGSYLETEDKAVTWTVAGQTEAGTNISARGLLTVAGAEPEGTLTVTATSTLDPDKKGSVSVTVRASLAGAIGSISPGSATTVTISGEEWYVLAKEDGKALLLAKNVSGEARRFDSGVIWEGSEIQTYLNGEWLDSRPVLKELAEETTIYTRSAYNADTTSFITSLDKVFLLSEADVFGTQNGGTAVTKDYTTGAKLPAPGGSWVVNGKWWWLRSPKRGVNDVAGVDSAGNSAFSGRIALRSVRPALWVNLKTKEQ